MSHKLLQNAFVFYAGTFEFEYIDPRETDRILEASKLIEALSRISPMAHSDIDVVRSTMETYILRRLASLMGVMDVSIHQTRMDDEMLANATSCPLGRTLLCFFSFPILHLYIAPSFKV
jgi:hypothetical protein